MGEVCPRHSLGFLPSGGQYRSWLRFRDSYRQTPQHRGILSRPRLLDSGRHADFRVVTHLYRFHNTSPFLAEES
jgi:hypothetical protein